MLACIACSKPELDDVGGGQPGSARAANHGAPRDPLKSLTSQIKDMALKFSGTYRQCKPGGSTSFREMNHHHHHHHGRRHYRRPSYPSYLDSSYGATDALNFAYGSSSSSTPTWDFAGAGAGRHHHRVKPEKPVDSGDPAAVIDEDGEPKEWVAQVEPGVHITFVSLPGGVGNDLKRIRFSREIFNKWQAQRWWGENFDRIMELYNVQRFNRQALPTPPRSDDGERDSSYSRTKDSPGTTPPSLGKDLLLRNVSKHFPTRSTAAAGASYAFPSHLPAPNPTEHHLLLHRHHHLAAGTMKPPEASYSSFDAAASRTTTSSRDEASASASMSNASDGEICREWIEQDEPGVYITVRELGDGARELRRVRFSRERFGEVHAKLWWEENRERIQSQYL